jgi:Phosphodiester glycosidase
MARFAMARPLERLDRPKHLRRLRVPLADGRRTTVHVATHDAAGTQLRVALVRGQQLSAWCAAQGIREALVGGFFTRPDGRPLGEIRMAGVLRDHVAFTAPWDAERACVHIEGGTVALARRDALPAAPRGDLLQAGPLLMTGGEVIYDRAQDPEGFSAGAHQFDSDITAERHPRAALAIAGGALLAIACDGRSRTDAGLTLEELATVCRDLGAESAINLDGGGSTTLIAGGRLRNRPRADYGVPEPGGRGIATALIFT